MEDLAMRTTTFDFAPLWRSTIGFDRFFDLVDAAQQAGSEDHIFRRFFRNPGAKAPGLGLGLYPATERVGQRRERVAVASGHYLTVVGQAPVVRSTVTDRLCPPTRADALCGTHSAKCCISCIG